MIRSYAVLAIAAAAAGLGLSACSESVSPEPLGDYTAWRRFDVRGEAPGHDTSYRIIYVNDVALDPAQDFELGYQEGSTIVKEIRDDMDGAPGTLRYLAIMRRDRTITSALTDEGGWLFSSTDEPGGAEVYRSLCWARCHVAAPYNGAWYDYRD
jgi:hypothetical protein